jgi:hypothetical protein
MNLVVRLPAMFVLGLVGMAPCLAFVSACDLRAGCHHDWREACTSRDAHRVSLQPAVSAQNMSHVCSMNSRRGLCFFNRVC